MIEVHYPPTIAFHERDSFKIFLAGTIDMGNSINWQHEIITYLKQHFLDNIDIFNPRRPDWNSKWAQSKSHPMFKRQVEWELKYQEEADTILMVFLPESKSPISLMELGSFKHKKMLVYNPEQFYRHGNVDIFCAKYNIPTIYEWSDYLIATKRFVSSHLLQKLAKHA